MGSVNRVDFSCELADGIVMRPVQESDAQALTAAFQTNRAYLAPWEPIRPEAIHTFEGQREVILRRRSESVAGTALPMVLAGTDKIFGLLNLSSIVRRAFHNAHLGYWIDRTAQGSGLMTAVFGATTNIAKTVLNLHRIEAATLVHNIASQTVLERIVSSPTAQPAPTSR